MYDILVEKRSGPFGLLRQREQIDKIEQGQAKAFQSGRSVVGFVLSSSGVLEIVVAKQGDPVNVQYSAEPERLRPAVSETLDNQHSRTRTTRREVTIVSQGKNPSRLVLLGRAYEPLIVGPENMGNLIANVVRSEVEYALTGRRF